METIKNKFFLAKVLPDKDPKNQGRYKVHIYQLMPNLPESTGIFVKNHVHKHRFTNSDNGTYGQYLPLQPGTLVLVGFYENDYNSGYIDRIISDQVENSSPLNISPDDRDDLTVIFKTPKQKHLFVVCEDTTSQPNTSIHLYFKKDQSYLIIDESGFHFYTKDNFNRKVTVDDNLEVQGNKSIKVDGEINIFSSGKTHIYSDAETIVSAKDSVQITADNTVSIKAMGISITPLNPSANPSSPASVSEPNKLNNIQ